MRAPTTSRPTTSSLYGAVVSAKSRTKPVDEPGIRGATWGTWKASRRGSPPRRRSAPFVPQSWESGLVGVDNQHPLAPRLSAHPPSVRDRKYPTCDEVVSPCPSDCVSPDTPRCRPWSRGVGSDRLESQNGSRESRQAANERMLFRVITQPLTFHGGVGYRLLVSAATPEGPSASSSAEGRSRSPRTGTRPARCAA